MQNDTIKKHFPDPDATTFHIEDGTGTRLMELGSCHITEASRSFVQFLHGLGNPKDRYCLISTTIKREVVNA